MDDASRDTGSGERISALSPGCRSLGCAPSTDERVRLLAAGSVGTRLALVRFVIDQWNPLRDAAQPSERRAVTGAEN